MNNLNTQNTKKFSVLLLTFVTVALIGLTACGETKDFKTLITEAKKYQQAGNDKAAIIQLKNAIQQKPKDAEARFLLGTLYNQSGDILSAEKELSKAISLGMNPEKVFPELGQVLVKMGEFQQVVDKTEKYAEVKKFPEITNIRANALMGLGKFDEAKSIFDQILAENPNSPTALIGLARYALTQRDLETATKLSEQAITHNPNNTDVWSFKANLLKNQNKTDQALNAFSEVIKLDPDNVSAYINRATIHIERKQFDVAKTNIDSAQKIAPGALIVAYTQTLLDFSQGEYKAAKESIEKILSAAPEHFPSILLAGAIHSSLNSFIQAEQYLSKYLKRIPGNLYARKLMANVLLKSNQAQNAVDVLLPALNVVKEDPQLLALAGEAYMKTGNYTQATEYFEKANKLAPNNPQLHTALGMSKLALGKKEHGIAELELASNLDKDSSKSGVLLALTHLRLKDFDKALAVIQKLEKTEPDNPLFQNLKGGAYMGKQDLTNARTSFNKALSLKSDYFPATHNLARIDLQEKKPEMAKQRFEAILKKDSKNIQAMNAMANLAHLQGNKDEVTYWAEQARDRNPDLLPPAIQLVTHYLRVGKKDKALILAQKLYGTHSGNPRVIEVLAQAQLVNDKKNDALDSYLKLVALIPDSAPAYLRIAGIHSALNDIPAAAVALKKAINIQPDYLEAKIAQANLAIQGKRIDEALSLSKKIQTQHPKSPAGYVLTGDIQNSQKKHAAALKSYEQAWSLQQTGPLIIKMHATLSQLGKEKKANARLAQWLKKNPKDFRVRFYLASRYLDKKQYDAAIKQYQTALELQPDHTISLNNLAWLYQQKKNMTQALSYAEKAFKQAPEAPVIMDTLGWILVDKGDYKRALPLLEKAATMAPKANTIQFHYASGLAKSGDKAKAQNILEKLLASGEKFPEMPEAKALLAKIK